MLCKKLSFLVEQLIGNVSLVLIRNVSVCRCMARYPLLVDHRIDVLRLNLFLRFLNCLDALSLVDSKADLEQLELLFQLIEELLVC